MLSYGQILTQADRWIVRTRMLSTALPVYLQPPCSLP